MLNTFTQSEFDYHRILTNSFRDKYEKPPSDRYVLFLVMTVMFFDGLKIPTSVLCRLPQGTFIPSFVPIGQVVSVEKSFEKLLTTDDNDGR